MKLPTVFLALESLKTHLKRIRIALAASLLAFSSTTWAWTSEEFFTAIEQGSYDVALEMAKSGKAKNNADAQFLLSKFYEFVALDEKGIKWLEKMAEHGDAQSQDQLVRRYFNGAGTKVNKERAFYWAKKLAQQTKQVEAQYTVAWAYENGQGTSKDYEQAILWLIKAANQGHSRAQFELGDLYRTGKGTKIDLSKAAHWYQLAAQQGNDRAQFSIGFALLMGQGVVQDPKQAFDWFMKSAKQGNANAQYNVARFLQEGLGTIRNKEEAYFWWLISASQGNGSATIELDKLEKELSPEVISRAQDKAKAWKPS